MSIKVALSHRTEYHYDSPARFSPHVVRLRPAPHCRTKILSYSLKIEPAGHFLNWQQDPFGNYNARIVFPEPARRLSFHVDLVAEIRILNPFDFFLEEYAKQAPFNYEAALKKELQPYFETSEMSAALLDYLQPVQGIRNDTVNYLVALNSKLYSDISYVIRMEPGIQSCETTLTSASGSCRDTAFLLVEMLRHLGFAARFVSGYLIQLKADEKPISGPAGPENDFTDLHAWAEVFLPGAGWVGLDPTSGLFTGEGHIPLAATPEPMSAAAITGFVDTPSANFQFDMHVERLEEAPRVTKPYSDQTYQDILNCGEKIDRKIKDLDLRLTIGGEPTFVSATDFTPEWETVALGKDKLNKATDLTWRLLMRMAAGAVLQKAQGKWYPGEVLPRWSLNVFGRKDGQKVWRDHSLLKDSQTHSGREGGSKIAKETVETLASEICESLNISKDFLREIFDPGRTVVQEGTEIQHNRSWKGFVLPLAFQPEEQRWESSLWPVDQVYLIQGDSPAGLRLPLSSIAKEFREEYIETEQAPLPDFSKLRSLNNGEIYNISDDKGREVLRSALVIEVNPHETLTEKPTVVIFIPPLPSAFSWLSLIHVIEKSFMRIRDQLEVFGSESICQIEGYPCPMHPDLISFSITPDPGVIEANLHPSSSTEELAEKTAILYEEARLCGLTTQKFMLDGRPQATGGGNHITVGAATTEDSPFLRNPGLLRSLATYWQHHPSLSYLFSGLFIGPTSQAPRIDEARHDSLYELEIAFDQLDRDSSLWMVDRLLRNHFVDLTGNTHRAELSIDKLFNPEGPHGRKGLVEMRAFEMPPHSQMSVAQQIFVMAVLCMLEERPYHLPFIRWGTTLHDRFMLPVYIEQDFMTVLSDLSDYGFSMKFFEPFFEFRFPLYGETMVDGMHLEVRMALEPWNVLGESTTTTGTSRAVDSAVERLQVQVTNFNPERFRIACNGYEVPMSPVHSLHRFAGGIRFKAWSPVFTLHPSIPVQTPIIIEVYDLYNQRYTGGCTYHVSHPGGLAYENPPINAYEAETRRISRFEAFGHSVGRQSPPLRMNPLEYPCTLDLRREKNQMKSGT